MVLFPNYPSYIMTKLIPGTDSFHFFIFQTNSHFSFSTIHFFTFQKSQISSVPKWGGQQLFSPSTPSSSSRSSNSIAAKPSSKLNKQRKNSEQDQKLIALRKLFNRPNVNIDAYIIPSQDAHQVHFCKWFQLIDSIQFNRLFRFGISTLLTLHCPENSAWWLGIQYELLLQLE